MEREKFLSAIYLIITNEDGKILLQRRTGTKLWPGYLALPAGHVDIGEDVYQAAEREAREELDIHICKNDIKDTFVVNRKNKSLMPYFDVYFYIESYKGEIKTNEPNKCLELTWVDINSLPDNMINFEVLAIKNWQNNVKFSTVYVNNEE